MLDCLVLRIWKLQIAADADVHWLSELPWTALQLLGFADLSPMCICSIGVMDIAIQGSGGLFDRVVIVYGLTRGLPSRYEAVSIFFLGQHSR
jgi:hypothetical protein